MPEQTPAYAVFYEPIPENRHFLPSNIPETGGREQMGGKELKEF